MHPIEEKNDFLQQEISKKHNYLTSDANLLNIKKDFRNFIKRCDFCAEIKSTNGKSDSIIYNNRQAKIELYGNDSNYADIFCMTCLSVYCRTCFEIIHQNLPKRDSNYNKTLRYKKKIRNLF